MNIIIVDDEKEIVDLIALYLTAENYNVHKFYDSKGVLPFLETHIVDLAILDIMMPGIDGISLCQKIREKYQFPILFVTAKVADIDKISGFNVGADDYITKPFTPIELVARVKAHLRRYKEYNSSSIEEIDFREIVINYKKRKVFFQEKELSLTPKEFDILYVLCKNKGQVVPVEKLYEEVWKEKYFPSSSNTIMVHIRHLRKKMKDSVTNPKYIKSVWGVGYEIEE